MIFYTLITGQNIDNTTAQISSNFEEKRKLFEKPSKVISKGLPKVKNQGMGEEKRWNIWVDYKLGQTSC